MPDLNEKLLRRVVEAALSEDIETGDVTSRATIPAGCEARGKFVAKEAGVLCGIPVVAEVFRTLDASIELDLTLGEGERFAAGATLAGVRGKARPILSGERLALNFLQRLSGIATLTRRMVEMVADLPVRVVDTRKTTPGLRFLEKYAVRTGGGSNHRFSLAEAVLIKDNHIVASGGIREAVERARAFVPSGMTVEVETESEAQVREALAAGADVIMLDNMSPAEMRRMVELIGGQALVEASGNVSEDSIRPIAETGVDIVSVGALTHSAPALDIGLDLELAGSRAPR